MAPGVRPEPSAAAQAALRRRGLAVLAALRARDQHEIFLNPVTGVPHYRTIVKRPMCLSVAEANLRAGVYKTPAQLTSAVNLIWSNAMLFNAADTIFHSQAAALKEASHRMLEEMRAGLVHEGFYVPTSSRHSRPSSKSRQSAEQVAAVHSARPPRQPIPRVHPAPRVDTASKHTPVRVRPPVQRPVKESDTLIGPSQRASARKRPRSVGFESSRSIAQDVALHDRFIASSAPLARRLLATILNPFVVMEADLAKSKALQSQPAPASLPKNEDKVVDGSTAGTGDTAIIETLRKRFDVKAESAESKLKKARLDPSEVRSLKEFGRLGSATLDERLRSSLPAQTLDCFLQAIESSEKADPNILPSGGRLDALKSLLKEHGIENNFLDNLPLRKLVLQQPKKVEDELLEVPKKPSSVLDLSCVTDVGHESSQSDGESSPSVDHAALSLLLDENHCAIMNIRRVRAEAEAAPKETRAAFQRTEHNIAAKLERGLSSVVKKLPPHAVARPVDVGCAAVSLSNHRKHDILPHGSATPAEASAKASTSTADQSVDTTGIASTMRNVDTTQDVLLPNTKTILANATDVPSHRGSSAGSGVGIGNIVRIAVQPASSTARIVVSQPQVPRFDKDSKPGDSGPNTTSSEKQRGDGFVDNAGNGGVDFGAGTARTGKNHSDVTQGGDAVLRELASKSCFASERNDTQKISGGKVNDSAGSASLPVSASRSRAEVSCLNQGDSVLERGHTNSAGRARDCTVEDHLPPWKSDGPNVPSGPRGDTANGAVVEVSVGADVGQEDDSRTQAVSNKKCRLETESAIAATSARGEAPAAGDRSACGIDVNRFAAGASVADGEKSAFSGLIDASLQSKTLGDGAPPELSNGKELGDAGDMTLLLKKNQSGDNTDVVRTDATMTERMSVTEPQNAADHKSSTDQMCDVDNRPGVLKSWGVKPAAVGVGPSQLDLSGLGLSDIEGKNSKAMSSSANDTDEAMPDKLVSAAEVADSYRKISSEILDTNDIYSTKPAG